MRNYYKFGLAFGVIIFVILWDFYWFGDTHSHKKNTKQEKAQENPYSNFRFKPSDVLYVKNPDIILTVNLNLFQDDEYFWTAYRLNNDYLHDAIIELSDKKPIDYYYQEIDFNLSHQYNILDKNQKIVWQHTNITDINGFCKKNCSHPNVTVFKELSPKKFKIDDDFIKKTSRQDHLTNADCQVTRIDDKKIKLFDKIFYISIMGGLDWRDYGKVWCNDYYTLFFNDSENQSGRARGILFDNHKKIPILFFKENYLAMQPNHLGVNGNMQARFTWYSQNNKNNWQTFSFYDRNIKNIKSAILITSDYGNHLLVEVN